MPVTPEYKWEETPQVVVINVTLPGAVVRKPDLLLTPVYLKVGSHPYLLSLDLHREVDADHATAELSHQGLQLRLPKVSPF